MSGFQARIEDLKASAKITNIRRLESRREPSRGEGDVSAFAARRDHAISQDS